MPTKQVTQSWQTASLSVRPWHGDNNPSKHLTQSCLGSRTRDLGMETARLAGRPNLGLVVAHEKYCFICGLLCVRPWQEDSKPTNQMTQARPTRWLSTRELQLQQHYHMLDLGREATFPPTRADDPALAWGQPDLQTTNSVLALWKHKGI